MKNYPHTLNEKVGVESELQELFRLSCTPGITSFAGGLPGNETFPPGSVLTELFEYCTKKYPILQYSTCEGVPLMREQCAEFLNKFRGISPKKEEVIITSGGQQALDFIFRGFSSPDIPVYVEMPTYVGALGSIRACRNPVLGVPSDSSGMIVEKLEALLEKDKRFSLVYVNPTFQNPAGFVMSNERKKALAGLPEKYNILVVEDEPYAFLGYEGESYPPIKLFDRCDGVAYINSFSKVFGPSLRIGVLYANQFIRNLVATQKQNNDMHTSSVSQYLLAEFLKNDLMTEHISNVISINKPKRDFMIELIREHLPSAEFDVPNGGMFLWLKVPGKNTRELFNEAIGQGIAFVPGEMCYPDKNDFEHMRLNFSFSSYPQIEMGIKKLGEITKLILSQSMEESPEISATG